MRFALLLSVSLTVASALDFVYDDSPESAITRESRLSAEREMIYQNQVRQSKIRMKNQVQAAKHQRSKWMTGHVQCLLRDHVSAQRQNEVLHWICSPEGANSTCKGIKPGGAHFHPNTTWDHLQWAMTSYHEHHQDGFRNGYRSCWFGGIAYLVPPPLHVLYFASNPSEIDGVGQLALSGQYPINLDQGFSIPSSSEVLFTHWDIEAKYDRKAEIAFKALARCMDSSANGLIEAEVGFDFDGDGVVDRTERTFPIKVGEAGDFLPLSARFRANQAVGSPFQDFSKGNVQLLVRNTGACDVEVREASERAPSHLQIPYFPY